MRMLRPLGLILALVLCCCDDPRPAQSAPTAAQQDVLELELKPLTPLLPNRPTHIAVDRIGNVYWVQESDRDDDTLFVIGEGDIPRATQLSASNVAAALGASGGRGNIHGLASGAGGEIYFYFCGALGRRTIACIGTYQPRNARIRILANTEALEEATAMGRSLALARGTVMSDARYVWVWLRHSDGWAMFRIEPHKLPRDGPVPLVKAFNKVTLGDKTIALTREEYEMSVAPASSLFLVDVPGARLLRIDQNGNATVERNLVGFPSALSTPAVDRDGRLLIFAAGNAELLTPASAEQAEKVMPPDVNFPALLIFDKETMKEIERDRIMAYPGFPIFGMRLQQLVPHAGEEGWISYDAGSGELLRLKIRQRVF